MKNHQLVFVPPLSLGNSGREEYAIIFTVPVKAKLIPLGKPPVDLEAGVTYCLKDDGTVCRVERMNDE